VICFLFIGRLKGVREGSIPAAVRIGNAIKLYNAAFDKITEKQKTAD